MTINPDTVESGPELDEAIALASGFDKALYGGAWFWGGSDGFSREITGWSPSTDWNDAMLAAEKMSFLRFALARVDGRGPWECRWHDGRIEAATGPLAICLAILKLKDRA